MDNKELTIEQSLDLLDAAAAQFRGTREDHKLLLQALDILRQASKVPSPPPT